MTLVDWIIVSIIAFAFVVALVSVVKKRGCSGCSGECDACCRQNCGRGR